MLDFIEIRNFRGISYAKLNLSADGLVHFITAVNTRSDYADSNGSGKTTLLYALFWALFDKHPGMKGAKSVLPVNAPRGMETRVEIRTTTGRGVVHVTRARTKSGVVVEATLGDGALFKGHADDVNARIAEFLGTDYATFTNLLFYTGQFSLAGQGGAALKTTLSLFLPHGLAEMESRVRSTAVQAGKDLAATQAVKGQVARTIEQETADRDAALKSIDVWETQRKDALLSLSERLNIQTASVANAELLYTAAFDSQTKAEALPDVQAELTQVQQSIVNAQANVDASTRTKQGAESRMSVVFSPAACTACGQALPATEIAALRERHTAQCKREQELVVQEETRLIGFQQVLEAAQVAVADLSSKVAASAGVDLTGLRRGTERARQDWQSRADAKAQTELDHAALAGAQNPHALVVQSSDSKLARLADEDAQVSAELAKGLRIADVHRYLIRMFAKNGLQDWALGEMTPRLSFRANYWMSMLSANDLTVTFQSQPEFKIDACSNSGADTYKNLSSGEQRRVDLAVFLAVMDISSESVLNLGFTMIDEMLDVNTDNTAREAMRETLIQYAAETGRRVYLTSNSSDITNDTRGIGRSVVVRKGATETLAGEE